MMRVPVMEGLIDRRVLVNFRADPEVVARLLPAPFRPKLQNGFAVVGICLIRLKGIHPAFLPAFLGVGSENAAHRMAVEWEQDGILKEGVYIPRRDTNSRLNTFVGGRIFPGLHHLADFDVEESANHIEIRLRSRDGKTEVGLSGSVVSDLPKDSMFGNLETASRFFEAGALGYSATLDPTVLDGLELRCEGWKVEALHVDQVRSSFFEDRACFPEGSIEFDCALLMRGIPHSWVGHPDICCTAV